VTSPSIDMDRLLKLRLVVARFGEMDLARWWNTQGQLGKLGAAVLRRGFPRTQHFVQARSVFAVAAHRCAQIFDPPRCVTLWQLPELIEEEFDSRWEYWLDHATDWALFFERVAAIEGKDLVATLRDMASVDETELERYATLRRSVEGRAVQLPGLFAITNEVIALLALGFARGEAAALCVPYTIRDES
jgi:hypothetical protein